MNGSKFIQDFTSPLLWGIFKYRFQSADFYSSFLKTLFWLRVDPLFSILFHLVELQNAHLTTKKNLHNYGPKIKGLLNSILSAENWDILTLFFGIPKSSSFNKNNVSRD